MPGPDDDLLAQFAADSEAVANEQRESPGHARRTVLAPVDVVGDPEGVSGSSTMGDASLDRVEIDPKPAPTPPTQAVGEHLEEMGRRRAPYLTPEMGRRAQLERETAATSPIWDALLSVGGTVPGTGHTRRTRERLSQVWDQFTAGDEGLGGRNPTAPIVGRDERPDAALLSASDTLSLGGLPRVTGTRERVQRAQEQAPASSTVGMVAGGVPWLALPGGGNTAMQRAAITGGQGLGLGSLSGALHSEGQTPDEIAGDAIQGGLVAGGLGAGGSLAADAVGAIANPRTWRQGAQRAQEFADRARLEASGFWGRRAMDQIDRAGGQEAVAADLRRYGIGQSQGQWFPQAAQAADDLATLGRGGGDTMRFIAESADEAGARIPVQSVIEEAERVARELEGEGVATSIRAAQRIRREVAPLAGRPDMTATQAWALRRRLDSLADFRPGRSDVSTAAGDQFRTLRQAVDRELDGAMTRAGFGRQWEEASRMSQLGIISRQAGEGHRRLSVGGGIGGADATAELGAAAIQSADPLGVAASVPQAMAGRGLAQRVRELYPGVRARIGETSARWRGNVAQRLFEDARRGGLVSRLTGPSARALMSAAARGQTAFSTALYVAAQRDPEVRALLDEYDMQTMEDDTTPEAIRAIGASGETQ